MGEGNGSAALAPRRDEALAFIIERIARNGTSPTFEEISTKLGVSPTRAKQLVAQLIKRGDVEKRLGGVRSLRVRDVAGSRNLLEHALRQLGWHIAELQTPFPNGQLPTFPPFEHLPDVD
ncbi:LexA family protein [Sphingomonas sp. UYP23]